eukprot:7137945-Prymnesium_polylepis.2
MKSRALGLRSGRTVRSEREASVLGGSGRAGVGSASGGHVARLSARTHYRWVRPWSLERFHPKTSGARTKPRHGLSCSGRDAVVSRPDGARRASRSRIFLSSALTQSCQL